MKCLIMKKRVTFFIVVVILIFFLSPCQAEGGQSSFFDNHEVKLFTSGWIEHWNGRDGYNEAQNYTLGVSVDGWTGVFFRNSHYDTSFLAGYDYGLWRLELYKELFFEINIAMGLLYGYGDDMPNIAGISLAALPTFEFGWGRFSLESFYVPFDGGVSVALFTVKLGKVRKKARFNHRKWW